MNNSSLYLHRTNVHNTMSPRKKTLRKVLNPPIIKGFKPYGNKQGKQNTSPVNLFFEEYEALRLCDYDSYNHHKSSEMMGVSRPTFTRIYAAALRKIASAFVEGRQISIEGGKVYFDSDWYQCKSCECYFNNPEREKEIVECPLCGNKYFAQYENVFSLNIPEIQTSKDFCICINCSFEMEHQLGQPCSHQVCPKCKSNMKRKGTHVY